jgi:uncharacterized OsmC-like protein
MADQYAHTVVRSTSSGLIGRSLNQARSHSFIVDGSSFAEEITSTEVFLAGVSSCGVNLIEGAARDSGIPLRRIEVSIDGVRNPAETPPRFDHVDMAFTLYGVTPEQADDLVGRYKNR